MREILFTEKRVDNSEWVDGYYTKEGYSKTPYIQVWEYGSFVAQEIMKLSPKA